MPALILQSHSLRGLVWTMQGHRSHLRGSLEGALKTQPSRLREGQRGPTA
jgi:hypothetical protein